jgi:hypothetical protein
MSILDSDYKKRKIFQLNLSYFLRILEASGSEYLTIQILSHYCSCVQCSFYYDLVNSYGEENPKRHIP